MVTTNSIDNTVGSSDSGLTNTLTVQNTSNTASSQATTNITVGGGTAGDTWTQYTVGSTTSYCVGIDNSDSDRLKINYSASGTVNPSSTSFITIAGDIGRVTESMTQNGLTGFTVSNPSNGTSAFAFSEIASDVAVLDIAAISSGYTVDAAIAGDVFLNAQGAGVNMRFQVPTGLAFIFEEASSAFTFVNLTYAASTFNANGTNAISIDTNGGKYRGYNTNTAPAAGFIGEILTGSNTTGTVLASATLSNITSVTLTPGNWDLSAIALFVATGTNTTNVSTASAISAANNNLTPVDDQGSNLGLGYGSMGGVGLNNFNGSQVSHKLGPSRVSIAANTTYYLNLTATAAVTFNMTGYGVIRGVRVA